MRMEMLRKISWQIDRFNEWVGNIFSWLIVPCAIVVIYDVFLRYVLRGYSKYAYDTTWMLFGAFFLLGGGYTLFYDRHVRIDVVYQYLSRRKQLYIDLVVYLVFFIPATLALLHRSFFYVYGTYLRGEALGITLWRFPAWIPRSAIFFGLLFFLLQAFSELFKTILEIKGYSGELYAEVKGIARGKEDELAGIEIKDDLLDKEI